MAPAAASSDADQPHCCTSAPPAHMPSPRPSISSVVLQVKASVTVLLGASAPSCSDSAVINGPKASPVNSQASANHGADGASAIATLPAVSHSTASRICRLSGGPQRRVPYSSPAMADGMLSAA